MSYSKRVEKCGNVYKCWFVI